MGLTLTWLSVIILIPLAGLFLKTFELSLDQFWAILTSRRTLQCAEDLVRARLCRGDASIW